MSSGQGQSTSTEWREKGNDFYRKVDDGLAPLIKASRLQEALNCYGRALSTATSSDDRSSACKNMAMAAWKMAKAKVESGAKSKEIMFYFKESLKHFQDSKEHGKDRKWDWHDALVVSSLGCWSDIHMMINELNYEERICEMEKLIPYLIDDATKAQEYMEVANHYFHWSVVNLCARDYRQALTLLADARYPLKEAQRFALEDHRLKREVDMLLDDMYVQQCVAESIQARIAGEHLLEYVVKGEEILNIDMIWEVIDMFRQAALLTRDQDLEMEATALSSLGKVYDQVLKMKDRAKACLMKALELANTMVPRNFTGEEWYEFARNTLERYQQETLRAEEEKNRSARKEVLKLIKDELTTIQWKHGSLGKLEFLRFIYTTHPPKNTQNILVEVQHPEPSDLRKMYQKAVIHYHPDKVQESEHGAKWKVLTEEICKLLTQTYEKYKGFGLTSNDADAPQEQTQQEPAEDQQQQQNPESDNSVAGDQQVPPDVDDEESMSISDDEPA